MKLYAIKIGNKVDPCNDSELISTFHKQNQHFGQKISFMDERIQNIAIGNYFIG
jgi:hypothetical protein